MNTDTKGGQGKPGGAPAYLQLSGEMGAAFNTLADAMSKKGSAQLLTHGKFKQTYKEGAEQLKKAENFTATNYPPALAEHVTEELNSTVAPVTEPVLAPAMKDMVDMASKYLAQNAEYNKHKGEAFNLLVDQMKDKGSEVLYANEKARRTYAQAAKELEGAKTGLESSQDDPNLSQEIHAKLTNTVEKVTPGGLTADMAETVDIASKYLSERATKEGLSAAGGVVTEDGYYIDENGVKKQVLPGETDDDFYIDGNGIRRKKKPGEETYIDAKGIRRLKGGMSAPVTAEGYYVDEHGVTKKIEPGETEADFYIDEHGIRRKKKPGEDTYVDEQGIRRVGKKPMAPPKTEEGYYVDEHGVKKKIGPGEAETDFYIDEHGNRRKKKPGEETYVDEQGIRRVGKKPMGPPTTEEGYYVDEHGVKKKIGPGEAETDFYIDEHGNRRKKKPGEETYVDEQGIRRVGKKPIAPSKTEEGYYVDEHGVKKKIGPGEAETDFYIDEHGNRRKKKPGEDTYIDEQGIRRVGKKPMAPLKTGEGYYVDEHGVKKKIGPGEAETDFYIDEHGIRKKKKPGEETYVDEQGIRRVGKKPMDTSKTEGGYYVDEHGVKKKIGSGEAMKPGVPSRTEDGYYIDEKGNKQKIKPGEEGDYYVDAQGVARKKRSAGRDGSSGDLGVDSDPDRVAAVNILHSELRGKGNAILYKQPHTELTYAEASKWLKQPRTKVDKTVKDSADTARLHKKFEKKLGDLVAKKTPAQLQDAMQDVVIESSRHLSENFVAKNYKALVTDGLIAEMQKKGNEILVEVDGAPETFFFAAQRLKKAESLAANEPCDRIAYFLTKQLDDMVKNRSMARKVISTMKEHIKEAADYLSEKVTKPDPQIEAYVALLGEMENAGDALLVEGDIPKSFKSCAAYLRQLTSFEDQINLPNGSLKSSVESKLKSIMANVAPHGYTMADLNAAISDSAKLLVSYIMLQGEKTEALKVLIDRLDEEGQKVLLRHGTIRKSCTDGAEVLRGKNADQLSVASADPVVARKIQIKLINMMRDHTPPKYQHLMDDVIEDTTMYLANYLLQPRMIQVCKCMKSVFVQCELWCDEILRRAARPCCTCSRHVSAQALAELAPAEAARHVHVSVSQCPSGAGAPCPAPRPAPSCPAAAVAAAYAVYSASYRRAAERLAAPERDSAGLAVYSASYRRGYEARGATLPRHEPPAAEPGHGASYVEMYSMSLERRRVVTSTPRWLAACSSSAEPEPSEPSPDQQMESEENATHEAGPAAAARASSSSDSWAECAALYWRMPRSMFTSSLPTKPSYSTEPTYTTTSLTTGPTAATTTSYTTGPSFATSSSFSTGASFSRSPSLRPNLSRRNAPISRNSQVARNSQSPRRAAGTRSPPTAHTSPTRAAFADNLPRPSTTNRRRSPSKRGNETQGGVVCTAQMSDWHAMMISLMWNVQAWRDWIQENIDRALAYSPRTYRTTAEAKESWSVFQRRVLNEALQWRQYNTFSRQLTMRLALRYRNKLIVSPTRSTNRTATYMDCQEEMMEIIEMFSKWTLWLTAVVKETDSLIECTESESNVSLPELRWLNFKAKVEEYAEDWKKYNLHLKVCWEQKYRTLIADWLPSWKQPGPVWVVSACGAVPSGAVAAGLYDQEVVWVARTTHRCNVLPGALHPSKHCCIVYADGAVHHYTKYQVMCNAEAAWVPWRAGAVSARAVRVAPSVHVGRVLYRGAHLLGAVHAPHYRCHVVIFGRPFAFNCYELLVLAEDE